MKETMKRLLSELLKDSSRSDRSIAKVLGVSQATVSRMRNKLRRDGLIREFTVIPDFVKMGFGILAIVCFKAKMKRELIERATKYAMSKSNIIFAGRTNGMGKNGVLISLHKDFADYSDFIADLMMDWGDDVQEYDTLLTPLKGTIVKPLSLKHLAEHYPNKMTE